MTDHDARARAVVNKCEHTPMGGCSECDPHSALSAGACADCIAAEFAKDAEAVKLAEFWKERWGAQVARSVALYKALKRAHNCATLRDDGKCDGCFASEALDGEAALRPGGEADARVAPEAGGAQGALVERLFKALSALVDDAEGCPMSQEGCGKINCSSSDSCPISETWVDANKWLADARAALARLAPEPVSGDAPEGGPERQGEQRNGSRP